MNKFFRENYFLKNIYVGDSYVGTSDEDFGSVDIFLSMLNSDCKEQHKVFSRIEYHQIEKIILYPEENTILIEHSLIGKKKKEKTYLQWQSADNYSKVLTFIVAKCDTLKGSTEFVGSKTSIVKPSAYSIATFILLLILIITAATTNAGSIDSENTRFAIQDLTIIIAQKMGLWGTIIATAVISILLIYYVAKAYEKSKVERIIYK